MPEASAKELLDAAIAAGEDRDYLKSAELLTRLLSQSDSYPEAFLYLGRARYALGDQGQAIAAFASFLRSGARSQGDRAAGYFFLGRSYLACGRPGEAVRYLRKSAALDHAKAPTWAFLGAALLKLRRTKAAVDCLERAVSLAPEDSRIFRGYLGALYARGVRLLARGDSDMARQMLGFSISNGLDGPAIRLWRAKALREAGRIPEAIADCEAALAAAPGDPSIRWLRAGLLMAAGRMPEALREFEAIRAKHPDLPSLPADDATLARLRASVAFREGRYKSAVSDCMALLRADPKDAALRAIAAESLRAIGELERSRNHWLRAIEAAPEESQFRLGLSLVLFDLGDYDGSLKAAERARKLGASDAEVDYYAVLCRSRLGEDPDRLIAPLQSLIRERGRAGSEPDPRLLFALGEALYRSGRPDLASGWFEKVLVLSPGHELSLLYRISVAESLGDEEARAGAYETYLGAYPDNQKLRREFVGLAIARGDWARAAANLEEALAYGQPDQRSRRLLAVAYRNSGRYREAAVAYRDLLREELGVNAGASAGSSSGSSSELLAGLAFCLDRDGNASHALALLEKAPASAKAGADPWILQAALYARSGKTEAAAAALRSAIERERGNERAWKSLIALYRKQGLSELAANCEEEAREALSAKTRAAKAGAATTRAARPRDRKPTRDEAPPEGKPLGLADLDVRSRRNRGG